MNKRATNRIADDLGEKSIVFFPLRRDDADLGLKSGNRNYWENQLAYLWNCLQSHFTQSPMFSNDTACFLWCTHGESESLTLMCFQKSKLVSWLHLMGWVRNSPVTPTVLYWYGIFILRVKMQVELSLPSWSLTPNDVRQSKELTTQSSASMEAGEATSHLGDLEQVNVFKVLSLVGARSSKLSLGALKEKANEILCVKFLAQCLAHKYLISDYDCH